MGAVLSLDDFNLEQLGRLNTAHGAPLSAHEVAELPGYLYGARAQEPALERLSFVLIGVATPSDLIKDAQRTPFNIGHRVGMTDFTAAEASELALGLPAAGAEQGLVLERVLHWTGGHPYLTLSAFASLRAKPP